MKHISSQDAMGNRPGRIQEEHGKCFLNTFSLSNVFLLKGSKTS